MHVRIRIFGKSEKIVVVDSKLTKIDQFRKIIEHKFSVPASLQRLFYGGKLLENGYTLHDYNIKINDVIQLMPLDSIANKSNEQIKEVIIMPLKTDNSVVYEDAVSSLYTIGDLVDVRDKEQGSWLEGKIVRIVHETHAEDNGSSSGQNDETKELFVGGDVENKPPSEALTGDCTKTKIKGIIKFFNKTSPGKKRVDKNEVLKVDDACLLYKVQLDADEEDSKMYCKPKDIRPRSRTLVDIQNLKVGDEVLLNHNTEDSGEKGLCYQYVKRLRPKLVRSHRIQQQSTIEKSVDEGDVHLDSEYTVSSEKSVKPELVNTAEFNVWRVKHYAGNKIETAAYDNNEKQTIINSLKRNVQNQASVSGYSNDAKVSAAVTNSENAQDAEQKIKYGSEVSELKISDGQDTTNATPGMGSSQTAQGLDNTLLTADITQVLLQSLNDNIKRNVKEDRYDIFGKYIATKLRCLLPEQRALAEKEINEVLTQAELSNLAMLSVKKHH